MGNLTDVEITVSTPSLKVNIIKKLLEKGTQLVRGRAGTKSSLVSPRKGFAETLRGGVWEAGAGLRAKFALQTRVFVRTHVVHSAKGLPGNFPPPWPHYPEASLLEFSANCCLP